MLVKTYIILLLCILCSFRINAQQIKRDDTEKLERAIGYFQGGKYHEALLLLEDLNKKYALNPRFKAYMGVCYYYEWDYKNACKILECTISELAVLAPREQSVYYYCLAESCFMQNEYNKAIPYYEKATILCLDNEKADILYRMALCYMYSERYDVAYEYFSSSLAYYKHFGISAEKKQRIVQISNMMQGCKEKF